MKNLLKSSAFALLIVAQSSFAICPDWNAKQVGVLDRNTIDEASGLTASLLQKGKFIWSNDSGGDSALYATGIDGKLIKTVRLNNFPNEDYEAVAAGPCPSNRAEACIYVGDIGDGMGWRSNFKIGIFKEADFWASNSIRPEKVINFSYPGGANNAEAMVVTPDGQILIFTKTEGSTQLFVMDAISGKMGRVAQVSLAGIVGPARGKAPRITDASISPSGEKVAILTYGDILEINLKAFANINSRSWKRGVDFNIVKGPGLPQQETLTYTSENSFIVSTESPDGDAPAIIGYSCK
ncbi:hypothetical protein [Peredibacter starrii]|uniref:Uncharacterized protein n=1 Tax=Peredibacter starrii TaxID=28202 RepID=A0AAX4HRY6_9BACT|nr:hypothetical protein [Peredibacter starrii]WPU65992.1 hypothetical protein SOO65_04470 [Peredibacter starrii]